MPLLELCNHLEFLTNKLAKIGSARSYKVGRIWQNLRLDLPSFRENISGGFSDNKPYPEFYPAQRGPNVDSIREMLFKRILLAELPEFRRISDLANSDDSAVVVEAANSFLHHMEKLWGNNGNLTIGHSSNSANYAEKDALPQQFCRYVNLKSFIRHTLLPTQNWSFNAIESFMVKLRNEEDKPGPNWRKLAAIWKQIRRQIEAGKLDLWNKPKNHVGEVNFIGDGKKPIHLGSPHPLRSKETLHYIIRELALPGWESPSEQMDNFGIVAIEAPSSFFKAYRPTMLDNLSSFSYFFLPGRKTLAHGLTWPLTNCLRFNSTDHPDGQPEWTVIVPPQGIPCTTVQNDRTFPAFQITGLSFGGKHGLLFEE